MKIVGFIFLSLLTFASLAAVHAHTEQNDYEKAKKNGVNFRQLETTESPFVPPASSAGSTSRQLEGPSKTELPTTYPARSGRVQVPKSSPPSTVLPAPSKKSFKLAVTVPPTDASTDGKMRKLVEASPAVSPFRDTRRLEEFTLFPTFNVHPTVAPASFEIPEEGGHIIGHFFVHMLRKINICAFLKFC
jgi:hypothetical protein